MARLQAHPFPVCGSWQGDMIHSAWCRLMQFHLSPLFSSPSFHPSITFPSFLISLLPSLSFGRGACQHNSASPLKGRDVGNWGRSVRLCVFMSEMVLSQQTQLPLTFPPPTNEVWLVSCGESDRWLYPPTSDAHLPLTLPPIGFLPLNRCQKSITQPRDDWDLTGAQWAGCQHAAQNGVNLRHHRLLRWSFVKSTTTKTCCLSEKLYSENVLQFVVFTAW